MPWLYKGRRINARAFKWHYNLCIWFRALIWVGKPWHSWPKKCSIMKRDYDQAVWNRSKIYDKILNSIPSFSSIYYLFVDELWTKVQYCVYEILCFVDSIFINILFNVYDYILCYCSKHNCCVKFKIVWQLGSS